MKKIWIFIAVAVLLFITACGQETTKEKDAADSEEELKKLKVDFKVPESAEPGENVELKATVTYGEEKVTDADEVVFEVWEKGNKDDSTKLDSTNHEDGTYTAKITFDKDGVYEMYAHTTARDLHTMPKKFITVGSGDSGQTEDASEDDEHADQEAAGGFDLHFMEPENVVAGEETELMVHLQMDGNPLEEASVRYEFGRKDAENKEWADAKESKAGEYTASHTFAEEGTYQVMIHVESGEDLHEHQEYEIAVTK
ncbi:hypothetical protein J32TS6_09040 [Virgibacillus pantothenticus]|uniref:YtkA-like domain-containing protein n=1 Tax=Virgibacillus pantothenticus TaxID=1473 RepID=A0A0L0QN36_VIRPA|nr:MULTISPECIES: FixH family protein [Virgibacillus]API93655.1 hypothetical protein BKP57_18645 [Virgibacillus sp. 6R]KNE19944.1 hypothetical protein AFK71_16160 [Virgibacillus pantothenticus]MBS7429950.1 FixH family protein [Virgibacillus sp. 19R1-5]MBU8564952.1 FixH family protein [Virgibacillus pantothenticus]MBU8599260.1 FixH family protein [Virgibacillus pantothenticus]